MHTDEFEISLHRELKICENTIKRIKTTLGLMEQKHHKTTEAFIEEYGTGKVEGDKANEDDYRVWADSFESLKKWQDLEQQYREQFQKMKI